MGDDDGEVNLLVFRLRYVKLRNKTFLLHIEPMSYNLIIFLILPQSCIDSRIQVIFLSDRLFLRGDIFRKSYALPSG